MSGTSLDGVDAALIEIEEEDDALRWTVLGARTTPYDEARRERIRQGILDGSASRLCRLHADVGEWLADAALRLLSELGVDPGEVAAVGSHGQTVWHEPPAEGRRGATLQLGCGATVAERTGIAVVSDFRSRDVAAGGHGAPLVPYADSVLFTVPGRARALQNVGGMANVTWLGPDGEVEAFDTGPGNALIDYAAQQATAGAERYDRDGRLAAAGREDPALLARLLDHPFFREEPPRSTGREVFGERLVDQITAGLEPGAEGEWTSAIATLTRLTARSIGNAYRTWILPRGLDEVFLLGGGARNPTLVQMIREELEGTPVEAGEALGIDPDAREAVAFAVLAWAHLTGRSGNVPGATGAGGPRVLGSYTPSPRPRPSAAGRETRRDRR